MPKWGFAALKTGQMWIYRRISPCSATLRRLGGGGKLSHQRVYEQAYALRLVAAVLIDEVKPQLRFYPRWWWRNLDRARFGILLA